MSTSRARRLGLALAQQTTSSGHCESAQGGAGREGGHGRRWEDNISREAHSQLVTSWIRVLQSLSPCPSLEECDQYRHSHSRNPISRGAPGFHSFKQTKTEAEFTNAILTLC